MNGLWWIEARCFTIHERSLYTGDETGLRAHLDHLSHVGWQVAAAYPLAAELPFPVRQLGENHHVLEDLGSRLHRGQS